MMTNDLVVGRFYNIRSECRNFVCEFKYLGQDSFSGMYNFCVRQFDHGIFTYVEYISLYSSQVRDRVEPVLSFDVSIIQQQQARDRIQHTWRT